MKQEALLFRKRFPCGIVYARVKNDGSSTNEEVFWKGFGGILGSKACEHKDLFDRYYLTDFNKGCNRNSIVTIGFGKIVLHIKEGAAIFRDERYGKGNYYRHNKRYN